MRTNRQRATGGRRMANDEGVVTAFVVIFAVALVFVTGLVLDGGRILAAKREAGNLAESAARAGAQEISDAAVRSGSPVILDAEAAPAAACQFIANTGEDVSCTARADGNQVNVTLSRSVDLLMLPVGNQTFTVDGSACVARGITGAEPTAVC